MPWTAELDHIRHAIHTRNLNRLRRRLRLLRHVLRHGPDYYLIRRRVWKIV